MHPRTVRVVNPNAPDSFMTINEADLRDHHERWGDDAPLVTEMRIAKGPGGRWFVKRGAEIIAGGFASEDEAKIAMGPIP